jgi:hypothetical protein
MPQAPLIVTFSDWNYQPILENWLAHLAALGVEGARIYCLDQKTKDWCGSRAVDAELLQWDGRLNALWKARLSVFNRLLESGTEFVHSDLDAVWLRNPLLTGSSALQPDDMVFSQGTFWPPDVFLQTGFVLCCGWFWIKPCAATQSFFRDLIEDVATTEDDQISVNRLLRARGVRWQNRASDYALAFRGQQIKCWHEPLRGKSEDGSLSVTLLPHAEYQRLPIRSDSAVVKHFLTPKRCNEKVVALRAAGLWKLA